jgi:hypothetical protein
MADTTTICERSVEPIGSKCKDAGGYCGGIPDPVKISNPSGGFVLWVELPATVDADATLLGGTQSRDRHRSRTHLFAGGRISQLHPVKLRLPWSAKIERSIAVLGRLVARLT